MKWNDIASIGIGNVDDDGVRGMGVALRILIKVSRETIRWNRGAVFHVKRHLELCVVTYPEARGNLSCCH